jgi:hypothetical protein
MRGMRLRGTIGRLPKLSRQLLLHRMILTSMLSGIHPLEFMTNCSYQDGSILLIRTNPTFQILFTNPVAHTAPIVSLAWRPEFSAARTYTEKDGKVHKSSAEDMTLLASCPATKGEFRIWAWSSKSEKLSGFRDEKNDGVEAGEPRPENGLQWSRNGKVVQFIEG